LGSTFPRLTSAPFVFGASCQVISPKDVLMLTPTTKKPKQLGIRVQGDFAEQLEQRANRENNSVSALARRLISEGLAAEERRNSD
jgi:hypothetical protein